MKKNEFGRTLALGAEEDISLSSYFELQLDSPVVDESVIKIYESDGLEIKIVDLEDQDSNVIFLANTYITYTTKRCDIQHSGQYRARLYVEFTNGTQGFYSPWVKFIVGD